MFHKWNSPLLIALSPFCLVRPAICEDLWQRRDPCRIFLFSDTQARAVGDLLTLIIDEDTDVDQRDDRGLAKEAGRSGSFELIGSAGGDLGSGAGSAALDGSASIGRNFDGSSSYRSARQFYDRITLTVMDVQPNGNLVVQGRRMIGVDRDQKELIVSGVVRTIDVNPDNTISSRYVSELRVSYVGEGIDAKYTRPGWLLRFVERVSPF